MDDPQIADLLHGAVDLHCHPGPSPFPRRIGIPEAAGQAADAGFRAMVVKSHHHSMVTDVLALQSPGGGGLPIPVFSGVALNNQVGGINAYAVELALHLGGKIVWFPTIAADKHICVHDDELKFPRTSQPMRANHALTVLDADGRLRPEVDDVLDVIRDHDAILACGHLDVAEVDALIRAARHRGLERIVVNHPNFVVGAGPEICAGWAELGATIEHSLCMYDDRSTFYHWGIDVLLGYFKACGFGHTVLGSDLGQQDNPLPVESYVRVLRLLVDAGVEEKELRRTVADNPAWLLAL
jgi:hypothetical protein